MRILTRYLIRAHLGPFLFSFFALTGVILINTLARRLADLAGKGLPPRVIAEFFILALPATLALTFPMAVLAAVLYTFSTLTAENEITALKASGVDLRRLLAPILVLATLLTVVMIWFNDRVLPESNHRWSQLIVDIGRKTPTFLLEEQTLNRVAPQSGGKVYYLRAARIEPGTNRMWDVQIFDVSDPGTLHTVFADSGRASFSGNGNDMVLQLFDGHTREVSASEPQTFRRVYFKKQIFGIPDIGNQLQRNDRPDGFRGDREMTIGMLKAQIDTISRQRADEAKNLRQAALADLEFALAGGRGAGVEGSEGTEALPADVGNVRTRTRRTADMLNNTQRQMGQLAESIRNYEVEIHKKYSIAVASLVFVIVGAPLALRFGGGGIGMVIATSMIVFSLYYVGLIGGESLAGRGIVTPIFAMWIMNALMTVVGLFGLATMGRETSTARSSVWDTLLQSVRDAAAAPLARLRGRRA
ncbi:LptF/LptG family permease [Longimicrobium sp.]|uniref:LptF/LptG family permease n=1 Tax=Longimicrobium sp. TaxID=2029185 RepID=UPI002E34739E|nr:LptF/LptG family permease [Longimicrobium sp.]HEX6039791.1 LptF/LptG family permease [Longimicrobium sp.]